MNSEIKKLITAHYSLFTASKGFTLIELAIVLVIVGMLVGMGAGLMGPLTKRAKIYETKEIINAAVESIIGDAASTNRITTTSEFSSIVRTHRDSWTKDLYYIPDANLDDLNAGGVCGRKTTGITVRDCVDAACTSYQDIQNVAFVVISGSENYNIQTDNIIGRVTVYEIGTATVDDYATDMNRPETYDDIVKWIKLDELRIKTGCVGPQIKILNNELPTGKVSTLYNADIYADGGVPNYSWCWQKDPLKVVPPWATFSCNGTLNNSATCSLTSGTWKQCTSLNISGTPGEGETDNFMFTFFVRDENDSSGTNDNMAQKTIVLTVNP